MAQIYISLGSNVDKHINLPEAVNRLSECFPDLVHSSIYESEPVGFAGNNFYNSVVGATTHLSLEQVCNLLKQIEANQGREFDGKKFSPRVIDLDLLFYDNTICQTPAQLPRDEITKNAFVLQPLAEIAPDFIHPVIKCSMATLWQQYDKSQQKLWKVSL